MKRIGVFLLLCIMLAYSSAAQARPALTDIAPPMFPPGANLQSGSETTQVQMVAETVLMDIKYDPTNGFGFAHVTADFQMRNLGDQAEELAVRFPISANDGRFNYPEIYNIEIWVNGWLGGFRRMIYPDLDLYDFGPEDVPWAEFPVKFPVGEDVSIRVSYDLDGTGYYPYTSFYYVLSSGAGWKGNIGRAEIILRLPYKINSQNMLMDADFYVFRTPPNGEIMENEARWVFEDFEPGSNGPVWDIEFKLVEPKAWRLILQDQNRLAINPKDGEAWGRLAKQYKELILGRKIYRHDPGGVELYNLSRVAYENCVTLKPDDAQWHAGFADLLSGWVYEDASWTEEYVLTTSQEVEAIHMALKEIHTALQLAPGDPVVLEIARSIQFDNEKGMVETGSGYDFPWLTQTPTLQPPTATPTPEPTRTGAPTATPEASPTPAPTWTPHSPQLTVVVEDAKVATVELATPTPQADSLPAPSAPAITPTDDAGAGDTGDGGGLCGSVVLVLLPLGVWLLRRRM